MENFLAIIAFFLVIAVVFGSYMSVGYVFVKIMHFIDLVSSERTMDLKSFLALNDDGLTNDYEWMMIWPFVLVIGIIIAIWCSVEFIFKSIGKLYDRVKKTACRKRSIKNFSDQVNGIPYNILITHKFPFIKKKTT